LQRRLPFNFEAYEGKSKTSQKNEEKPFGTRVETHLKTKTKHLAREGLWFEEVIYDKCQQPVKMHHCDSKFNIVNLIYVALFACSVLTGLAQTSCLFEISTQ